MSNWQTIQVEFFSVYSPTGISEFNDLDEAIEYAMQLRQMFPDSAVEVSAFIDWEP